MSHLNSKRKQLQYCKETQVKSRRWVRRLIFMFNSVQLDSGALVSDHFRLMYRVTLPTLLPPGRFDILHTDMHDDASKALK